MIQTSEMTAANPEILAAHAAEEMMRRIHEGEETSQFAQSPIGKKVTRQVVATWLNAVSEFERLKDETILTEPAKVLAIKRRMDLAHMVVLYLSTTVSEAQAALHRSRGVNSTEDSEELNPVEDKLVDLDADVPGMAVPSC